MFKIIGGDGREYGPVTLEQISGWIAQNRANGQTKAQAVGTSEWKPLAEFPDFAPALAARPTPPPLPEPGILPVPSDSGSSASVAVSFPAAPEAAAPTMDRAAAARACVERRYELNAMECLSGGWQIVTSRFWLTVGGTILATALMMLAQFMSGAIPRLGFLVPMLLSQVLIAGVYWLMLRVSRGEPAELVDVFGGFFRNFPQLVRLSATMFLLNLSLLFIAAGPLLIALQQGGVFSGQPPDLAQLIGPIMLLPVLGLPALYFGVAWTFAPFLVVDRGLGFWEALQVSRRVANKHWFQLFFIYLAMIPLMIAGLLCFLVGAFVVAAVMYATYAAAYETAFAERPEQPKN